MTMRQSLRRVRAALAAHGPDLQKLITAAFPDASPDVREGYYDWVVFAFWLGVWGLDESDDPTDRKLLAFALGTLVARLKGGPPPAAPAGAVPEPRTRVHGEPPVRSMTEATRLVHAWGDERQPDFAWVLTHIKGCRPELPDPPELWDHLVLAVWNRARHLPNDVENPMRVLDAFAVQWCLGLLKGRLPGGESP
jgi:hypothetical protein